MTFQMSNDRLVIPKEAAIGLDPKLLKILNTQERALITVVRDRPPTGVRLRVLPGCMGEIRMAKQREDGRWGVVCSVQSEDFLMSYLAGLVASGLVQVQFSDPGNPKNQGGES